MAHEMIILEATLVDYSPPLVAKNPFKDKQKKNDRKNKVALPLGWRNSTANAQASAGTDPSQQAVVGKVQLIQVKASDGTSSSSGRSTATGAWSYWLRFLNVSVRNEKDLPAFVLLSRTHVRDLSGNDKSVLKQLELHAETILLDWGPDGGQWKGCHMPATIDQELFVFDPLAFGSIMICKPSAAKPPSILPLVFAYGAFQSYSPPQKSPEQIALEMEALSTKLLSTVMEIEQSELQGQAQLSLDELQRNAKQLFKMFDQDKSNSIDFEEYQQMLAYRKLNLMESKARRFFQLVDDQKKGYIDEREFVIALYITNYLRVHAASASNVKPGASNGTPLLSPVDVFYQMDADRDELLNVFEYEKALALLGVPSTSASEIANIKRQFPKNSPSINLEQFKTAWLQLVDVKSELRKRNISASTVSTSSHSSEPPTSIAPDAVDTVASRGSGGGRSSLFATLSQLGASSRKPKEIDHLRQLLLESIVKEEREELQVALKAKDEVIQLEKACRDADQEEKRKLYNQQRHTATSMRTQEGLRERQEKIARKKERVVKERQAKEERRLLSQIANEADKRKTHEMQAMQEHMASKMDKITLQKAKCGDDVIDLCGQRLKKFPASYYHGRDALNALSSLLILDLSKNRLQTLPSAIFSHLFSLQALNMSENELEELPIEIGEARDLQVLDLHSNKLQSIPEQLKHLHYLKVLNLAYNKLTTFGNCCEGLHALEELNLSSNCLESIAETVGYLSVLQKLQLRGNPGLKLLPRNLQQLGTLVTWDFSACEQKRIAKDVFGPLLGNLRSLNLAHNSLSSLPLGIGKIKKLQELVVKHNLLLHFPPQLCELRELVVLNARNNKLERLPDEIDHLAALESLFLSSNKFTVLPPTIGLLRALQRLNLQNNQLTSVPLEMGALVDLRELNLSWNEISELPEEIGCLSALRQLNLSHNRIAQLPEAILLWQALETLSCSHNWLTTPLTASLGELQTLRYLDLSHNQLTHLEPCVYELEHLEVLNVASNQIEFLPKEMAQKCQRHLKKLDLYNNKLVALPVEMAQLLPELEFFSIERNPMKYLPEKWSDRWRLEDQYKTSFAKGYTSVEVKEWVHDQSLCYPVIVSVWKHLTSQIQPEGNPPNQEAEVGTLSSSDPVNSPAMSSIGCDEFIFRVREAMGDAAWQNRFERVVRHYFYEFKYRGHVVIYEDISTNERMQYEEIEQELQDTQKLRADNAIEENNAFRAHVSKSYSVDIGNVMVQSLEKRKLHEQKLLAELRSEAQQLNDIVGVKFVQSLAAREQRLGQQRTQFAIDMKRAAREKQLQRLARKPREKSESPGCASNDLGDQRALER